MLENGGIDITQNEIVNVMERCSCGTRIEWMQSHDITKHRGVVDEYYPQNGAEEPYLSVIEPGHFIPVLSADEIQDIKILEGKHYES